MEGGGEKGRERGDVGREMRVRGRKVRQGEREETEGGRDLPLQLHQLRSHSSRQSHHQMLCCSYNP